MTEAKAAESAEFSLPFVWPRLSGGTVTGSEDGFPLNHLMTSASNISGIVSDLDERGIKWLEKRLQEEDRRIFVIIAVYAGCLTRSKHLSGLLGLQESQEDKEKPRPEFRILPMKGGVLAPTNCLTALPEDKSNSVFLLGSTPNFGIADPDPTQFSMAFQAAPNLTGVWVRWFDNTWKKAVPLTESTARIPDLVPATGSSEAATQWREYCQRLKDELSALRTHEAKKSEPEGNGTSRKQDPESPASDLTLNQMSDKTLSEVVGVRELDEIAERTMRLVEKGRQAKIDHRSAVAPLEVPFSPDLLRQNAENREGTVIQHQSFRISAFSKEDLKKIEKYRKSSQTIISKLGLPMGTGLHWMPYKMSSIYERETSEKNKEFKKELAKLVGSNTCGFVESKRREIEQDLYKTHIRLGGVDALPTEALTVVLDSLVQRIQETDREWVLAKVTFSGVTFDLQQKGPQESPWAQVEKLILALAKFPRIARRTPEILSSELITPQDEILEAMNIADDVIFKRERRNSRIDQQMLWWEIKMIERISTANIAARSRCEACFMIIDGVALDLIENYVSKNEMRPQEELAEELI